MLPPDDPRRPLLALLAAHPCADEAEAADVHRIAAFVAAHPDCFGKANPIAHITASAFVLDPAGRVLLTHHKKLARWLQLGGHSDPDEHDPAATALREATEESGLADLRFHPATGRRPIDVDAHRIPARKAEAAHDHLDLRYALCTDHPAAITLTDESHALRWFTPAEIEALDVDPAFRRALAKVVALGRP
ncbi:MAG: NUDIX domain-containing protein [Myxococcales bacterium]|nr:NUDIX domain-containing protein [Myxococcales bacterium]